MIPIFFILIKDIEGFLYTVNSELEKISQLFKSNKLSINIKKTKFTLFQKSYFKNEILKFPALMIGNNNIERKSSIKYLGVMLDEHLSWIDHVRTVENKIVKNIDLLCHVSQFLDEDSVSTVYFLYIHSYLFELCKYCMGEYIYNKIEKSLFEINTCSTHCIWQKQTNSFKNVISKDLSALNVYQINTYQHLNFMHRFINNQIQLIFRIFSDLIKRPVQKYPTNFSH